MNAAIRVGLRILLSETRHDRIHIGPTLFQIDARFQTPDHVEARMRAARLIKLLFSLPEQNVDVRLRAVTERGRRDADHGVALVIQAEGASDDARIAAEPSLPEAVAE